MLFHIFPIYGATGASLIAALPVSEEAIDVSIVPLLLVPAAFVYQVNFNELRRGGAETLIKLRILAEKIRLHNIDCKY